MFKLLVGRAEKSQHAQVCKTNHAFNPFFGVAGPVLFPQAPADSGMTSGVIVGASGFGFVPPNQPGKKTYPDTNFPLQKKKNTFSHTF